MPRNADGPPAIHPLLARAATLRQSGRPSGRQSGRPEDALPALRQAARLAPSDWRVQHDLGLACLEAGHVVEAVGALRRAVAGNPTSAQAHWRLGIALQRGNDGEGAIGAFRAATQLLPGLADAQYRLAGLLESFGHRTEAVGCYRRAASSTPKTSLGRLAAARAFVATHDDAKAERALRHLLALDPANPTAHELLGTVLADAGWFSEARSHYDTATAQAPWLAGAYYDLVRCRPLTPDDQPLITRMQASLADPTLEDGQRLKVRLALGNAHHDLGNYQEAMQHFDAADAIRSGMAAFDLRSFERRVEALIAWFTPERIAATTGAGSPDPTPVLIVGMPRSGTTLVEQIVSSHPGVAAGGELHFWNRRGAMMERAGEAGPLFVGQAAADCLQHLRGLAPAALRITDKMPSNFLWAGLVHLAFPRAAIIHCRRLAIDTALSIHQTHFSPRLGFPTGGTDLVGYYRAYDRLTAHWRRVLPPDRFLEIDYEALTREPAAAARQMIEAIGLPWVDACLRPDLNDRRIRTASKWQARQPVYRTAIGKWRRYEAFLGPLAALAPEG